MSERWLAWKSEGIEENSPEVDFNGKWKNTLESVMELEVTNGKVTGTYRTAVGAPGKYEKFSLTGFVNGDLISFIVSWGRYGSMTAWVGQHTTDNDGKNPRIETMWQLVHNIAEKSEPHSIWGAFSTGANIFSKVC